MQTILVVCLDGAWSWPFCVLVNEMDSYKWDVFPPIMPDKGSLVWFNMLDDVLYEIFQNVPDFFPPQMPFEYIWKSN